MGLTDDCCPRDMAEMCVHNALKTFKQYLRVFFCYFRPFLNTSRREILADYALPIAIVVMSFFGSFIFQDIKCKYACHEG